MALNESMYAFAVYSLQCMILIV